MSWTHCPNPLKIPTSNWVVQCTNSSQLGGSSIWGGTRQLWPSCAISWKVPLINQADWIGKTEWISGRKWRWPLRYHAGGQRNRLPRQGSQLPQLRWLSHSGAEGAWYQTRATQQWMTREDWDSILQGKYLCPPWQSTQAWCSESSPWLPNCWPSQQVQNERACQ